MPYGSTSARSYPVSLVYSGAYYWGRGNLSGINNGSWWTGSVYSYDTTSAAVISQISNVWLYDVNGAYKEWAMTLRCVEISAYGSTSARSYPVSLVYTGAYFWIEGSAVVQNYVTRAWSQNINSAGGAYSLGADGSHLTPNREDGRLYGFPLRLRLHFRA